jgi:hypothetical protein
MKEETGGRMATRLLLHFEKNVLDRPRSERSPVNGKDVAAEVATIPLASPPRHHRHDSDAVAIPWKIRKVRHWDIVHLPQRWRGHRLFTIWQCKAGKAG